MIPNLGPHVEPLTYATSLTATTKDSSTDSMVTFRHQVVSEHFVHESFLSLAFNVDQQACHWLLGWAWPSPKFILFPKLPQTVVFEPLRQLLGLKTSELSTAVDQICNQDIFRLKVI